MMKRTIALLLVCAALLAGCGAKQPVETAEPAAPAETAPVPAPAPLEILETVWSIYGEEEKFPIFGGNIEAEIMDVPGSFDLSKYETLPYTLLVPEDQIGKLAEAASMIHLMNANTFTCGAFKLKEGSAEDFAATMKDAVLNNQWMCGFPERLRIFTFGTDTLVMAFGAEEIMEPFTGKLTEAYGSRMALAVDEQIL